MILLFLLQAAAAGGADFDLARVAPPARGSCAAPGAAATGGDVVVCGVRPDRHRLPLPRQAAAGDTAPEASGKSAITPNGRCGIFAGERRCSKREALAYGYGGGRDPVSVAVGVVTAIVDPDR
jgi:hypothetical protein